MTALPAVPAALRGRAALAVLVPTIRTLPLTATALGVVLATAVTLGDAHPLVELRNAAVLLACTLPLSVDDACAAMTGATPVPLWRRTLHRVGPPAALVALIWTVLVWAGMLRPGAPASGTALWVSLELAGLALTGLAVATSRARVVAAPRAGLAGAATVFALAAAGSFVPHRVGLWPVPSSPGWVPIHLAWAAIAAIAAGALSGALRDPARP